MDESLHDERIRNYLIIMRVKRDFSVKHPLLHLWTLCMTSKYVNWFFIK